MDPLCLFSSLVHICSWMCSCLPAFDTCVLSLCTHFSSQRMHFTHMCLLGPAQGMPCVEIHPASLLYELVSTAALLTEWPPASVADYLYLLLCPAAGHALCVLFLLSSSLWRRVWHHSLRQQAVSWYGGWRRRLWRKCWVSRHAGNAKDCHLLPSAMLQATQQ